MGFNSGFKGLTRLQCSTRSVAVSPVADFNTNHRSLNVECCEMRHSLSEDIQNEIDDVEKRLFTCIEEVP